MRTSVAWFLFAVATSPASVLAQDGPARPPLEEAEWHLARGEFPEARAMLQRWRRENPRASRSDQQQQARFHLLSGRLTTNADSAEDHYLNLAVNFPTSRHAPEALLRLAQARHARGDDDQAVTYLRRLINDYPQSDQRTMGAIWLVRIESTRGASTVLMCDLLRNVDRGTNPEIIENLKLETDRVCSGRNLASRSATTRSPATVRADTPARTTRTDALRPDTTRPTVAEDTTAAPEPAAPEPAAPTTPIAGGRVSVQVGAFRELEGAREAQVALQNAGISDVRLVRLPGNNLIRVRIGRFVNRVGADPLLARLAAMDVSAVLVTDADKEIVVRN